MRSEARIIFVAIHVAEYVSSGNLEKSKCQIFSESLMQHEWIMDSYISKKNIVQTLNEKLKSRWYLRILIYQVFGIKNEKQQKAISELSNIRSGGIWDKHERMRWLCIVQVVKMGFWGESNFTIFQVFKSRKYRIRWLIAKKKPGSHIKLQYIVLKEMLFLKHHLN